MADRDFKGVWIPKDVWLDTNLTMLEKGILVEIDSLDMSDDGCWASNEYLATFCQCSIPKVASAVSKLVNLGYIKRESFDGRRRKLKSCFSFFKRQTYKNYKADLKKVDAINTSINTSNKDTPRKSAKTVFTDGFDDFWAEYPRPVAKQKAREAWAKVKPDEGVRESILADVRRRKAGEWKDIEERYIPHPSTYLNQRRWEDEPERDREPEKPYGLYCDNLSPEELMRRQKEQAEKDREEARRQGLL